jgi:hypothetical protein
MAETATQPEPDASAPEYAASAAPPECREQLAAFRELAIQNARCNLKLHDRRRLKDRARIMFALAVGTSLLAGALAVLARMGYPRWTADGALALSGLAILPTIACLWHAWRLRRFALSRRRFADNARPA